MLQAVYGDLVHDVSTSTIKPTLFIVAQDFSCGSGIQDRQTRTKLSNFLKFAAVPQRIRYSFSFRLSGLPGEFRRQAICLWVSKMKRVTLPLMTRQHSG